MNTQQITSIARQVLALVAVAMGVITASVTQLHLPPAVSSILVVVGGVIIALEHYLSDPSTGTPTTTTTTSTTAPTFPPAHQ
jgi:hypothetical protein